jgi:hypothetical protein
MEELNRAYEALQKAHDAGDEEAAKQIAAYARSLETQAQAGSKADNYEAGAKDEGLGIPESAVGAAIGSTLGAAAGPAVGAAVDTAANIGAKMVNPSAAGAANMPVGNSPAAVRKWLATQTSNPDAGGRTMEEAYRKSEIAAGKPVQSRGSNVPIRKGNLSIHNQLPETTLSQKAAANIINAEKVGKPGVARRMAGMGVAGAEIGNAIEEAKQGHYGHAALSGLGALGGAATQSRIKPIRAIGTGLSLAVPAIQHFVTPDEEEVQKKAAGGEIVKKLFTPVASKILKASEALGAHEGKNLGLTQTDNFGVHGGRMGGNRFPDFQNTSPIHQQDKVVWMNDSEKHAQDMINKGGDNTIWSTYIGAADQLKSNKSVFNDILQQHYNRNLTPEQIELINQRIANVTDSKKRLIFPQSFDIRDKFAAAELGGDTFARRGAMADILGAGEGVGKTRGGIALPQYQDILRSHRDPLTEGVPTSSVGTRLFSVDPNTPTQYSQKYHPDYNWTVHGQDTGVQLEKPIPQHLAVPDWYNEINARAPGKTHGNAWFSYMKDPQKITEEYLSRLQKEGYAAGGKVLEAAAAAFKKKFTPGFYHGSPSPNIKAFDTQAERNPNFLTALEEESNDLAPRGFVSLTRNPKFSNDYATGKNATVYPVSANLGKHFDPRLPENYDVFHKYWKSNPESFPNYYGSPASLPKSFREAEWSVMEDPGFLEHLKSKGYNSMTMVENGQPNIGIFEPQNIRGKFAKYNPEDAESPDFMKKAGGLV